jgi:hypothetical protein
LWHKKNGYIGLQNLTNMKKILVIVGIALFFAGCNNSSGWSAADRQKGTKLCMDEVAGKADDATTKKYCNCFLEKMMQKYKTYAEADKNGTEADGTKMGEICLQEIQAGDQKDKKGGILGGGGWTDADNQKFMNTCLQNAMNAGADQQTSKAHCDCTLKKIQKKYKSYDDANQKMTTTEMTSMEQECVQEQNGNNNQ